jgi:hypothetical protein
MWTVGSWLLYNDNVPAHTALSDSSWQNIKFLPFHNPPIHLTSPFWLFPILRTQNYTWRRRFQTVEDIITNATNNFKTIPQTSFEQCFQIGNVRGRGAVLCKGTVLKGIIFSKLKAEKDYLETNFRKVRFCICYRYKFKFDGNSCVFVSGLSYRHVSMNAVSNFNMPEIL